MRLLLALPLLALPLVACGDDGPRTSQTRDVAAFTRVLNDASVDVRVHVGSPERVEVRAGENVVDDVRTEVKDGTLRVDFEHSGWGGDDVEVEAWTPRLDGITADGSGDIEAEGVAATAFSVTLDGSGDVRVRGTTNTLEVVSDGSGDTKLDRLQAQRATVHTSGSGDVDVRGASQLDVTDDGSGDVRRAG